ncbi:AraC family transcriptional regulator [Ulvibacterium sp.]|uniref:helix-turn-helix domain-containing protein n=1 Tax=Ulvibacterium sp. TaxID=2665914 RepID=UPI00260DACE5|nr:helix-turn-helix transcriptional regulator [Ulvibacterium sp.]
MPHKIDITYGQDGEDIVTLLNRKADSLFLERNYVKAVKEFNILLAYPEVEQAPVFKKLAVSQAALGNNVEAAKYVEKYLLQDFKPGILSDSSFDNVRETEAFRAVVKKYLPKFNFWSFLYLYVALIGFYIAAIIHFNKKIEIAAKILISSFIFIHSFFILHIFVNLTNNHYKYPHTYAMSTCFSFLYGPLLYFYFKRIAQEYKFKVRDLLHLTPTLLFLVYVLPIYVLSGEEKLGLLLDRIASGRSVQDITIIVLKLSSLAIYGFFIRKIYLRTRQNRNLTKENKIWQKNIFRIHIMYVFCYAAYGILLGNNITSGFLYHMQVISMASMVMYVGYSANVQPNVFSGLYQFNDSLFFKYEKSGLTDSLSKELREKLIRLFDIEKIYKESDISLEMIAKRLDTTRHNASQVINEHFNMNFHELVNKYRIREAKDILNSDQKKNLNIIDIAYEVGYNNKVTFNKAFKKDTSLTPSEYQKTSVDTPA